MKATKRKRSSEVSLDVASALQQHTEATPSAKTKKTIKDNISLYVKDDVRLTILCNNLALKKRITGYSVSSAFADGLPLLLKKYDISISNPDEWIKTSKGRRRGKANMDENLEKKYSTSWFDEDDYAKFMSYLTYKVLNNPAFEKAQMFEELMDVLEEKYKKLYS